MGADIHLWVEKKVNNQWEIVKGINVTEIKWYENALKENIAKGSLSNYKHMSKKYLTDRIEHLKQPNEQWLYDGRSYNLFAILADVRNRAGFNPISEPKGVPEDASETFQQAVEMWDWDGHSHSYFTLRELKDYNWDQEVTLTGVVSESYYHELKQKGESPESYSGGISGRDIVLVDEIEMNHIVDGNIKREPNKQYFVRMRWKESYKEAASGFYNYSIKQLEQLSTTEDEDDVRIVFFFDN